jgi:uncharacterized protein YjcR
VKKRRKKMEYKNEREKAIFEEGIEEGKLQMKKERAYRMHEMGGANWRIAQILGESESTIERWIYEENWNRGREEGMQLLAQVALMLLEEERYEDLKKLGDERFRDQVIEEYEKKKQEETGTPEPR